MAPRSLPDNVKTLSLFLGGMTIAQIAETLGQAPNDVARVIGAMVDLEYRMFRGGV